MEGPGPAYPVIENSSPAAGQQGGALLLKKVKLVRKTLHGLAQAPFLAITQQGKQGQHERLVVRKRHSLIDT